MRHFKYLSEKQMESIFAIQPKEFNRNSEREILAYAVGATLYMPSYQDFLGKIINKELSGLTSFVMCFEDAIREEDVERGERNVKQILGSLADAVKSGIISDNDIPLFFVRVRNLQQFKNFVYSLTHEEAEYLSGFTFPKFDSTSGEEYLWNTVEMGRDLNTKFYAMPILESPQIIYQETRMTELLKIKEILNRYRDHVLNVRVGGTDFSSLFALRRGIDCTMYDLMVVANCLQDVLNQLMRSHDGYVISAPVWEYFSNQRILKPQMRVTPFHKKHADSKRKDIIDHAIDGLVRELILDKANGFAGKTIIHPSHIGYVNGFQTVTKEEFDDATMVVESAGGGVLKSFNGNKMNEMNPHMNWAKKILLKASVYGVVKGSDSYVDLI